MKKIIRLTESELTELIRSVIVESSEDAADIAELKSKLGGNFKENKNINQQEGFGFYRNANGSGQPLFNATLLGVEPGLQLGMIRVYIKPVDTSNEKETKKIKRRYKSVSMQCGTTGFRARWHRQETLYAPLLHDFVQQTYCQFFRR